MKTAEEVCQSIMELPPDKLRIVAEYIEEVKDDSFKVTCYSDEDMAKIEQDALEAKQGINVSGPFKSTDELFAHLDSLEVDS